MEVSSKCPRSAGSRFGLEVEKCWMGIWLSVQLMLIYLRCLTTMISKTSHYAFSHYCTIRATTCVPRRGSDILTRHGTSNHTVWETDIMIRTLSHNIVSVYIRPMLSVDVGKHSDPWPGVVPRELYRKQITNGPK